jgi:hypothetical protein
MEDSGHGSCTVLSRKAFLVDIEKFIVKEHHHNAMLCIFLLSWLLEIHFRRWSKPANREAERKDIKVFRKLINELDTIHTILEIASQTPERQIFDYITDYARKFIADNYPSDGTALSQDGVQEGLEGDEINMLRNRQVDMQKEIDALRTKVEALTVEAV